MLANITKRGIPELLIFFNIIVSIVISSCTAHESLQSTAVHSLPSTSATEVSRPLANTKTPSPTAIQTATPINGGSLSEKGPWLMYSRGDSSKYFVNQDGTGKTELPIDTEEYKIYSVTQSIVHKMLAVQTYNRKNNRFLHTLYIFSLPDMTVLQKIDLYPYWSNHTFDESNFTKLGSSEMQWSPDEQYLAFSAVIDGPSLDLYVYDVEKNQIKRLTSGKNQVGLIHWSPDSRWIVHEEVYDFHGWSVVAMWAAAPDGSEVNWLYKPDYYEGQDLLGWVGNNRFVTVGTGMDGPRYARVTDLDTNQSTVLYRGYFAFSGPIYDEESGYLAFSTAGFEDIPQEGSGLYLLSVNHPVPKLVSSDYYINGNFRGDTGGFFLTNTECQEDDKSGYYGFKSDGVIVCVQIPPYLNYSMSPDGQWKLSNKGNLCLYKQENDCLFRFGSGEYNTLWRNDSIGFYMISDKNIYYVSLDDLTPFLIDGELDFNNNSWGIPDPIWIGN